MRPPDPAAKMCAHLKRYLELLEGDPDFRRQLADPEVSAQQLLAGAGLELPVEEMAPFFRMAEAARLPKAEQATFVSEFESSRLGRLWIDTTQAHAARAAAFSQQCVPRDPRAQAWRARRLARARSEAILAEDLSYFPLLAFELSQGCSVQCWFCALDPEKLKGSFAYTPENRELWRGVLGHAWDLFGSGCQNAICYHGTDPTDNPDYFRFQEDLIEIFGTLPQVTTAQPLRDMTWTRTLLDMQRRHPESHHRFSVLSLGMLRRIHQAFTPEELADVSLVLQHKEALGRKVECGRATMRADRLEAEARYRDDMAMPADMKRQTTCECTCGYLVNMVTRRIQLISPATPSEAAPLGYAIHADATFTTGAEFRAFLDRTVTECMSAGLEAETALRFWDDVQYERLADGFRVTSRFRAQTVRGGTHFGLLGDLLRDGTRTTAEITDELIQAGMPVLDAVAWLDRVYQTGVIAEP